MGGVGANDVLSKTVNVHYDLSNGHILLSNYLSGYLYLLSNLFLKCLCDVSKQEWMEVDGMHRSFLIAILHNRQYQIERKNSWQIISGELSLIKRLAFRFSIFNFVFRYIIYGAIKMWKIDRIVIYEMIRNVFYLMKISVKLMTFCV